MAPQFIVDFVLAGFFHPLSDWLLRKPKLLGDGLLLL
jgi:hypothetical protein